MIGRQAQRVCFVAEITSFRERLLQANSRARGIAAGDEGATRGRANGRGGIGIDETNALRGQAIQIWSLIIRTAKATEIAVAEIVGEDENDVRATRLRVGDFGRRRKGASRSRRSYKSATRNVVDHARMVKLAMRKNNS